MKKVSIHFPYPVQTVLAVVAVVGVISSLLFTNRLAEQLEQEEHRNMEIWADATRRFITASDDEDIDFYTSIIERNTTIPVYMVDAEGHYLTSRNVREPKKNLGEFYAQRIAHLQETQTPIEVKISGATTQYIYYEDSLLLRQLHYFPYIQLMIIVLFVALVIVLLITSARNEQNRVWVGLSKETAHQLGTPISSLNGWSELLQAKYPEDTLLPEMDKDIERLQDVAERFSKVGSQPCLKPTDLLAVTAKTMQYMQRRTSGKVAYELRYNHCPVGEPLPSVMVPLSATLFEWVLENLCKNAVDAMESRGRITIDLEDHSDRVLIDLTDTGKGIDRRYFRSVFKPGYTTKTRGWGLGLSLAKRIVEQYHKGKIFVKQSVVGSGTTFRIVLKK